MDMEEISYRVQELTGSCLDKCPIMDNRVMVGSVKCQDCKYNNGSNIKMNTIKCKVLSFYNKIEDLTKENEKLKKDKRRMAIDCQIMMEDRDNKYIENKQLKDLLKDK